MRQLTIGKKMSQNTDSIELNELPEVVTRYLKAHKARELTAAIECYAPHSTVTDDGKTYRGLEEIEEWLRQSASEFTYTIETTGAIAIGDDQFDVMHHLEGDFPGGAVDLHF